MSKPLSKPPAKPPRIAARAIILHQNKLLLVNAYLDRWHLWCAPGGGVEPHTCVPDNLRREVWEECGLEVSVGALCLLNEFHDEANNFHQIELFFRCEILSGDPFGNWQDTEGVVSEQRWVTRAEYDDLSVKPSSLGRVAWSDIETPFYDTLEPVIG